MFQVCFRCVSGAFQVNLRCVLCVFGVSQVSFRCVSGVYQVCLRCDSGESQMCFRCVLGGVSRVYSGESEVYLAGPDGGDEIVTVLEDVEDLDDASGVSEHRDARIRHGQVKGQVVSGLQGGSLSVQDEEHDAVPEPGQPTWKNHRDRRPSETDDRQV